MPLDLVTGYNPTDLRAPIRPVISKDLGISFDGTSKQTNADIRT